MNYQAPDNLYIVERSNRLGQKPPSQNNCTTTSKRTELVHDI